MQRHCEYADHGLPLQIKLHRIIDDEKLQDGMHTTWSLDRIQFHVASAAAALKPVVVRQVSLVVTALPSTIVHIVRVCM